MTDFSVLMICTANHCRSPIAEQLLRYRAGQLFGSTGGWLVESAGTDIPGLWPLQDDAYAVLSQRIPQVAEHHSRQVARSDITGADLILTASRRHRAIIVGMVPAAIRRTFTILQFARLCSVVAPISGSDPGELGRQLVVEATLARSSIQPVPGELDDLADPMGRPRAEFVACADRLDGAIAAILRPLLVVAPVPDGLPPGR